MKKGILLLAFVAILSSLAYAQKVPVTKSNLSKMWKLEKYEVLWIDYDLEDNEKNDYMHLKPDMTFESVDEGEYGTGKWKLVTENKEQYLVLMGTQGELRLIIDELRTDRLVLVIDDEEFIDLEIHFITENS